MPKTFCGELSQVRIMGNVYCFGNKLDEELKLRRRNLLNHRELSINFAIQKI
ncbi:hypothetical protein Hanom_Chr16g01498871 [Helianthus anomalus]